MDDATKASFRLHSIGMVSPGWPAEVIANGVIAYVASISRAFGQLAVDCHVMTPHVISGGSGPLVHVVGPDLSSLAAKFARKLRIKEWNNRAFCAGLRREICRLHAEKGLQLVEIEESFGWASQLAGRIPVPLVVRLHGPWFLNGVANGVPQDAAFAKRVELEKAGIIAADAITGPSNDVIEQTRAYFGLPLPDAQVIPNPVELVPQTRRWSLQKCDPNRIVFVGRFDRHKGGDTMIDAFHQILAHRPDASLDFVGPDSGCLDDAGRNWNIQEYLQHRLTAPQRARVTYHGFKSGAALAELRTGALVTVAPSRYETFGIAAAEAMTAGCPLVVCGAGALNEVVQDGCNGFVARVGDAADVAEKVLSLLSNPQQAATLGERAAVSGTERYAPHVIARQTAELYRRVLSRHRTGTRQTA